MKHPAFARILAVASATCGWNCSTKHGTNRPILNFLPPRSCPLRLWHSKVIYVTTLHRLRSSSTASARCREGLPWGLDFAFSPDRISQRLGGKVRAYLIDEIPTPDIEKARQYLSAHAQLSAVEGLFWLEVPHGLLTGIHLEHTQCQPYCVAIEVGAHFVKFELLLRSRVNHRCSCSRYADEKQREFVIAFAEDLIRDLSLRT